MLVRNNKSDHEAKINQILDEAAAILHTDELPLWYYILAEAEVFKEGNELGEVGGRIVGEVLLGLIDHYRERTGKGLDLIVDPVLAIPGEKVGDSEHFTFASILAYCGLADDPLPTPKPKP
ncbi:hypothetical protein [Breoghania sp.]|uniref:hypothetical protein n=1 Tax=Breoghania sp. TaxID=2065378 RepID=UPI002605BE18|nr:hypothetical protein [Breoghania sp.]MDJ0933627.1 hypothetical protein [Breoghania sp.]